MPETNDSCTFMDLKRALQSFQSNRLNDTYADVKDDPEYSRIGIFFFEKLYAPEDFTFRDTSMRKLQKLLEGRIYRGMVSAMHKVIELHELTEKLDDLMVEQMQARGIGPDLTMEQYREIYRALDNYDERLFQIGLSLEVTQTFYGLSKKWIVAISLKTVRSAAHLIGVGKILDFIHEGYQGLRAISDIGYFIDTVRERETAWHRDIWGR